MIEKVNCVGAILDPANIYWNVIPLFVDGGEDGSLVQLQWGWTAGMTEKNLEEIAEDAPKGFDSVTMTWEGAIELRDKLNELIEVNKNNVKERKEIPFDPKLLELLDRDFSLPKE